MNLLELRSKRDAEAKTIVSAQLKAREKLLVIAQQKTGWGRTRDFLANKLGESLQKPLADYCAYCVMVAEEEKAELERLKNE